MNNQNKQSESDRKTLYLISWILQIITCCTWGLFLIPLAYLIPMTLMTKKAYNEVGTTSETNHTGLAICVLIFSALVSGILAIIASSMYTPEFYDKYDRPARFTRENNGNDF